MTGTRKTSRAVLVVVSAALCACYRAPTMTSAPPRLPRQAPAAEPTTAPTSTPVPVSINSGPEPLVTVDTHGRAVDVRPLLDFVATKAGISLVYAPDIEKKVQAHLIDVPVSTALKALLSEAGLTLESVEGEHRVPSTPAVVFYELPVNVDSLSVDAIMKRFGVGRSVAEMIVQSRVKP